VIWLVFFLGLFIGAFIGAVLMAFGIAWENEHLPRLRDSQ
jgi:hypothetical protein